MSLIGDEWPCHEAFKAAREHLQGSRVCEADCRKQSCCGAFPLSILSSCDSTHISKHQLILSAACLVEGHRHVDLEWGHVIVVRPSLESVLVGRHWHTVRRRGGSAGCQLWAGHTCTQTAVHPLEESCALHSSLPGTCLFNILLLVTL